MQSGSYILDEHERWGAPLVISFVLHGFVALVIVLATIVRGMPGQVWGTLGAGGGAMSATIVRSIPLPSPQPTENTNVLANENKGLSQSKPPAQQQAPDNNAIEIARSGREKEKPADRNSTNKRQQPQQQPDNQIPYGQGGPANALQFSMGAGTGGLNVEGTGDFAGRYGWYVEQVRNKIAQNWSFYQVDPNVPKGARVTISFEILRNGQPANISMKQPSSFPSLNDSAAATLKRIDTFGPLPGDYRGSSVRVDFYFER